MATVPSHVFRAYDIRGAVGKDITEGFCRLVGRGFGSELRERTGKESPSIIVGRDARTHGPAFERALLEGLKSTGCRVLLIGQTPSPLNYFTLCNLRVDGSIQITASHNPAEDNGLKLQVLGVDEQGKPHAEAFAGEDLQRLRKRIEEGRFVKSKGMEEKIEAVEPYTERVIAIAPLARGKTLKVVVDTGNGVAGPVYTEAIRRAGAEVIGLFTEPDGTFPNHIADPSKHETLVTLQERVRKEHADCGIAFDGDGDRVGFVDEEGTIVSPDSLLLLLAEDHLKRKPEAAIIYTVSMSSVLETEVKRMGGKPVMCVVGHSFVEHAMREHASELGGEQSGHFFCGEGFFGHDDALVAALRVLSIFSQTREVSSRAETRDDTARHGSTELVLSKVEGLTMTRFSSLFSHFPKVYQTPEWRPHCGDKQKSDVVRRITKHFQKKGYPCITMDGVRIDFGEGAWAGIRQSNTSPRISVCMEARSPAKLREIERLVREHLGTYDEIGK